MRKTYLHFKKSHRSWSSRFSTSFLIFTALSICPGLDLFAQDHSRTNPYQVLDRIGQAMSVIEGEYYSVIDQNQLAEGALKGLAGALDPHSQYFTARSANIFRGDTNGEFGGIGVEVEFVEGAVVIINPIEGSPAARAGILSGDKIITVNDQPLHHKKPQELVEIMRGKPGTVVRLSVRQAGDNKLKIHNLKREIIKVTSVKSALLHDQVLYLRIKAFQAGTTLELVTEIAKARERLNSQGEVPQGVILDLRNNPGGLVREAKGVANEFLSSGVIFSTRHRQRTVKITTANSAGSWTTGALVLLLNEYSASAAELVAGALKDQQRATLVGARSFGKGSVQTLIPLSDGAAFKLTTALYFTPSGRSIQAEGIQPHLIVDPGYQTGAQSLIVRESDLEGHIEQGSIKAVKPERPGSTSNEKSFTKNRVSPPTNELLHLGVARIIPVDPETGPDEALKVAYRIIRALPAQNLLLNPNSQ